MTFEKSSLALRSLGVLAVGAAVFLGSSDAYACSPPIPAVAVLTSSSVPVDGFLVGRLCSECKAADLKILDADNHDVAGTFEPISSGLTDQGLFAWKPSAPLTAGTHYTIAAPSQEYQGASFDVVASDASAPTLDGQVSRYEYGTKPASCQGVSSSTFGTCSYSETSIYAQTAYVPLVELAVKGSAAGQYIYSVEWSADGSAGTTESVFGLSREHVFSGTPKSVCYSVKATPVSANAASIDLGKRCLETAGIGELGVFDQQIGDPKDVLPLCTKPPVGYEDAWCDIFASAVLRGDCYGVAPQDSCQAALAACPKPTVDPGDGTAGAAGASGDNRHGDGLNPDSGNGSGAKGEPGASDSGGCSIAGPIQLGAASSAPWLMLMGAIALFRRRRSAAH